MTISAGNVFFDQMADVFRRKARKIVNFATLSVTSEELGYARAEVRRHLLVFFVQRLGRDSIIRLLPSTRRVEAFVKTMGCVKAKYLDSAHQMDTVI
jgi:hypothetical protein